MRCYIDTSVLLVYTLASGKEPHRLRDAKKLFDLINAGTINAITSFYALHELYIFALENTPDFTIGSKYGKEALRRILLSNVRITPLLSRVERMIHAKLFEKLLDPSDMPHAISAKMWECDTIVAYDDHFKAIRNIIGYRKPEDIIEIMTK